MEYSNQQLKRFFLAIGLRTGVAVIIGIGAILFFSQQIGKESQSLYNERTLNAVIDQRQENIEKLKKDFEVVRADVPNMEAVLPDQRNIFEVLRVFEAAARASGNTATITFSDPLAKEAFNARIPFHFVVSGTIQSFEKYLRALEQIPYGVQIISLQVVGSGSVFDQAEMRMEALVLFQS